MKGIKAFKVDLEALTAVSSITMEGDKKQGEGMENPLRVYCINTDYENISYMKRLVKKSVFKYVKATRQHKDDEAGIVYRVFITREIK